MPDDLKLRKFIQDHLALKAETFRLAKNTRFSRERPRALVVEDQLFSRRLLYSFLVQDFQVDLAEDVRHGLQLFMDYAPDIIFLDIELPDETGHTMASIVKKIDPTVFIAMVTASNASVDVNAAIQNHVDGFIVKPYNKQKIVDCLEKYRASRKPTIPKGPQE